MAVLNVLVSQAGEPVTKDALFAAVLGETSVSDDALTSCIQELRRALDDDSKQPKFIETRHRRDTRAVGQHLGVATLLEGSVRKADNRLRVTVQLIEVATGYHRWSQRFDLPEADCQPQMRRSIISRSVSAFCVATASGSLLK